VKFFAIGKLHSDSGHRARDRFGYHCLFLGPSRLKGNQRAKLSNPIQNRPIVSKIGPGLKLPKLLND
jgi:hypothetical protein